MSLPYPFHPFTICFPLFLYPYFFDPAVFPSGCCSSALELSCWKCQKLAFSPCRVTVVSLISSMHFLFACWNCVGLGLLLGGCCVFTEETFVSQKSFAAPCHCPKSIDRLCLVLLPCLHFLSISYPFLKLCSLSKTRKNWLAADLHLSSPKNMQWQVTTEWISFHLCALGWKLQYLGRWFRSRRACPAPGLPSP